MENKEQGSGVTFGECKTLSDILHENDRLRKRVKELEQKCNAALKDRFGKIKSGLFFRRYVGEGDHENGEKFEIDVMNDFSPSVYYKGKTFMLSWHDILELATLAGLFSEVTE